MMRLSGVELCRSISIFLILVVHTINLVIGVPSNTDLLIKPIPSVTTIFFESISIVCVDVFIIISGWFEIHSNLRGLVKLLFQCVFFYIVEIIIGFTLLEYDYSIPIMLKNLVNSFFPGWFISAYIMLYILSPVINNFISTESENKTKKVLLPIWILMTLFGWLFSTTSGNNSTFCSGYSTLFLIILYFSIRYIKNSKIWYSHIESKGCCFWMLIFFSVVILDWILWIVVTYFNFTYLSSIIFLYTSPLVILQSFSLFMAFLKFNFKSRVVNFVGGSSLSIMLFHFCCGGYIFKKIVNDVYSNFNGVECILLIFIFLLVISIVAIIFDQFRILLWHRFESVVFKLSK